MLQFTIVIVIELFGASVIVIVIVIELFGTCVIVIVIVIEQKIKM